MRSIAICIIFLLAFGCNVSNLKSQTVFTKVTITPVLQDSTLSIRALTSNTNYLYYGSADHYGKLYLNTSEVPNFKVGTVPNDFQQYKYQHKLTDSTFLNFRAVTEVNGTMFALSIGNPAKLYKLLPNAKKGILVYEETHPKVFYDAIQFWNANEGIAIGDPTDDCLSILITRDGGNTWRKLPCDNLPKTIKGEAAFAASNTNIKIIGTHTWIASGGKASRVYYSNNKGKTWEVFKTPITQGKSTTGMYSIDFYDAKNGFAIGGDYTQPNNAIHNKITTTNGGKTWQVVANTQLGYRSCVQYVPNSNAKQLVAVGFKGVDYSADAGTTWTSFSNNGFYTIHFVSSTVAYAAGKGGISKLQFY